jgi:ABC-type sulfate transport system substrate-binding protein
MTTTYTDYKFSTDGVDFVSRIYSNSPFASRVANMDSEQFAQLNSMAIRDVIGNASLLTRDELLEELDRVNEGGTHAFILLDEGSN